MQLSDLHKKIADDAFAASFQTMGQYRTALLKVLAEICAQADALPVAIWVQTETHPKSVYWADDGHDLGAMEKWLAERGFKVHRVFDRPAEASSPGLSGVLRALIEHDDAWEKDLDAQHDPVRAKEYHDTFLALKKSARAILTRATTAAEPSEGDKSGDPWTDLLDYVLQDDLHNRLTPRVIDIAYTAFTAAKQPNKDDGGPSDWFNDTRPVVREAIEKLRKDLYAERAAQQQAKPPEQTSEADDKPTEQRALADRVMRWNPLPGGGMNPHPSGMYVRFEDIKRFARHQQCASDSHLRRGIRP